MNTRRLAIIFSLAISADVHANDAAEVLAPAFDAAEARQFDTAIEQLSRLSKTREAPIYQFHLARIQHRAGDYDEALETIEDLLESHPEHDDAHYLAGLIHLSLVNEVNIFRKVGVAKRALAAWQQAVDINPAHIDARYAVFAFYANAPGIAGGDVEEAERLSRELEKQNAGYGAMATGVLASQSEDFEAAEAAFREAARLLDRAGPHFVLAQHYAGREQWKQVLEELDLYAEKRKRWWDPDITAVHLLRARAFAALGDPATARTEAERGLALSPNEQIRDLLEDTVRSL